MKKDASSLRGQMKAIARRTVPKWYGFELLDTVEEKSELATALIADKCFLLAGAPDDIVSTIPSLLRC